VTNARSRKKRTTAQWKKKLWPVFAKWIKERDGYQCFTCGRTCEGQGAHAGHYIPKSICGLGLYFDELNVHCQCYNCNMNLGGYGAMYERNMVQKYGKKKVDALWKRKGEITKELNWEELWERYKNPSRK
jgi:hypothetical protein